MNINIEKIKAFIKLMEGVRLKAYQDSVGIWTIGYGSTGPDVYDGLTITQQDADDRLEKSLNHFINNVKLLIKVPLNENQSTAIISLVYNIGEGNFRRSSVLTLINQGNLKGACEHIALWNRTGIYVNKGLENRRAAEMKLFNS